MKATVSCAGALLLISALPLPARSQCYGPYYSPALGTQIPCAPNACGPGFYTICPNGTAYGPNYCVRPPGAPFNGMLPGPKGQEIMASWPGGGPLAHAGHPPGAPPGVQGMPGVGYNPNLPAPGYHPNMPGVGFQPPHPAGQHAPAVYRYHPYVRSPRDFFMWGDVIDDQLARERRPAIVP